MSAELTLGAEEELHLIDLQSWKLSARAPQLLSRLPTENFAAEIQRSTVETNTEVVDSLDGLRRELLRLRKILADVAAEDDIGIAAVGRSTSASVTATSPWRSCSGSPPTCRCCSPCRPARRTGTRRTPATRASG